MGVKDGFMGASTLMKVVLILLIVANLFNWIAFTTTSWGYINSQVSKYPGYGLWRTCTTSGGCSRMDGTRSDWYASFQAFGIFGFAGTNVAMLLVILAMFVGSCKGNAEVIMASFIICFVAAVCWLISVIIFAAEWPDFVNPTGASNSLDKFGFSFALAIVSLVFTIVAGVLLIVDSKGGGTSPA